MFFGRDDEFLNSILKCIGIAIFFIHKDLKFRRKFASVNFWEYYVLPKIYHTFLHNMFSKYVVSILFYKKLTIYLHHFESTIISCTIFDVKWQN